MSNGPDLQASLERIQRIVQTQYDLLVSEDAPEASSMLSDRIMNIGQFIATEQGVIGSITQAQAQKFYEELVDRKDQASKDLMTLAITSITIDQLGLADDADLTALTPDQQDTMDRYFFGKTFKDPEVGITFEPKAFTLGNAETLVDEITKDLMADSGITDKAVIENMKLVIAETLYADWEITPDGGLILGALPDLSNLRSPLFEDALSDRLKLQTKELFHDPENLLRAEKVEEILELLLAEKVITKEQKKYMKFPGALFSDQEREELGQLGSEDRQVTALMAMMDSVTQFIDTNWANVLNSVGFTSGVDTLPEAYLKLIKVDKNLPPNERELPPVGFDPVTQRQDEADERFLSAFGKEGKPFNDR